MRSAFALIACCLFIVNAQQNQMLENQYLLDTAEDVAGVIDGATREVLLATGELTSKPVAEALHRAVKERGVELFILIDDQTAAWDSSYTDVFAALGANVRLIRGIDEPFIIVDWKTDSRLVTGPLVGRAARPTDEFGALYITDSAQVDLLGNRFLSTYKRAPAYSPTEYLREQESERR